MKQFSFFHRESGALHRNVFSTDDETQLESNTPKDHAPIEGQFDHLSQRVNIESGKVIDFIPQPPSADHVWNPETKRWQPSAAARDREAKTAAATSRIAQLEASQHRHVREHCLGVAGAAAKLQAIDDEIFSLRSQLTSR